MKRILSALFILILLLAFNGCSKTEELVGAGTESDPYRISTAGQLFRMAELINSNDTYREYRGSHYLITADIDLGGKKWTPIGTGPLDFCGVLDGGGHTVSNFQIHESKNMHVAFIANFSNGTVKDITVSNATISGNSNSSTVAAIVGRSLHGTVENCHTTDTVTVTSTYIAAGICANYNSDNPLVGCTNAATVTAEKSISCTAVGIVYSAGGSVINCSNYGTITSNADAAGITSSANGDLFGCLNTGTVTAKKSAAGITLSFDDGALNSRENNASITMENCLNSGAITSKEDIAGGIAVSCRTGIVKDCVNTGPVSAVKGAGGIFAYFQRSAFGTPAAAFTVSGCDNSGAITVTATSGNEPAGGICAQLLGGRDLFFLFENCNNSGTVLTSGQKDVMGSWGPAGGIIGTCDANELTLLDCANFGDITGVHGVGGIIGRVQTVDPADTAGTVFLAENCTNAGDLYVVDAGGLTTELYCGGIVGVNGRFREHSWVGFETLAYNHCRNTGKLSGDTGDAPLRIHELCGTLASDIS